MFQRLGVDPESGSDVLDLFRQFDVGRAGAEGRHHPRGHQVAAEHAGQGQWPAKVN